MRGFVPTPEAIVDLMVDKVFAGRAPTRASRVLDPGCGDGAFEEGIVRWCERHGMPMPSVLGVELDKRRADRAAARFLACSDIEIRTRDFLRPSTERFDYVIGNPPYVSITGLSEREKEAYRGEYQTARGRFDLYLLFFEQSLRMLKPGGRLVFITPEKFLYVKTAEPLRRLLGSLDVRELILADEATFGRFVAYPVITVLEKAADRGSSTSVTRRDGSRISIKFPRDGSSVQPLLQEHTTNTTSGAKLADVSIRVSCGIATGADKVFVHATKSLPEQLRKFAHPTISGRQLVPGQKQIRTENSLLLPYDSRGNLLTLAELGALRGFLGDSDRRLLLEARTCVRKKPWYAFHDSVPLRDILQPKILCKDITAEPEFWVDRTGKIVPQHSVYYVVPNDPTKIDELAAYLNSAAARNWIKAHCQRAANGFLRVQSSILKHLPVPPDLAHVEEQVSKIAARPSGRSLHADLQLTL